MCQTSTVRFQRRTRDVTGGLLPLLAGMVNTVALLLARLVMVTRRAEFCGAWQVVP